MNDTIRAVNAELKLAGDVALDCYMLPDGEKRIGVTGASLAIGRSKEYLGRLPKNGKKALKALQEQGFTGCQIEVQISSERYGTRSQTISVRDFIKFVTWDAITNRRSESIVLLAAFGETGLERILDDLFSNRSLSYLDEKIKYFERWTNEDLQEALAYNREDWKIITEQELFLDSPF